ncbi:MAG: DUF29 domain-containing protein [Leptolyngbya sp. IPPAS B-1204]|nr:DUF29 domain-containing protein [Elainella sp. C42_A2020_010]RNJ68822.1 MAG: DUF29 domain-containing protein [Leptolyngbya sp. IPPAS B-1204]
MQKTTKAIDSKELYQQDLVAWCSDTVAKLKASNFSEIDIDSLIEEIEGLAGRDRRELESRLEILLNHLLKRMYVDSPNDYRGWERTIREQRRQLQKLLKQSPSLRNYWMETFSELWVNALADAREDYPDTEFPDEWQFSRESDLLLSEKLW